MKIYEVAVKKPISTILIFLGVIIFGLYSLRGLAIDFYPEMDIPAVSVMTTYSGANAADIETNVTRVLEDNLNTVDKLKTLTSRSSDNVSLITLEFEWGSDIDAAANDVRDVIGRVQGYLPDDADTPAIFKFSSSMIPVMILYATADESYNALSKILDDKLVNTLNRVDGVGAVSVMGSAEREIQVNVDPYRMEAYGLTVEQVGQLIQAENLDTPSGDINIGRLRFSIRSRGELSSGDELKNIVVATRDGKEIHLSDIAVVKDTIKEMTLDERINGEQAYRIIIQKQSGANTVEIAKRVTEQLPKIQETLPPDVHLGIVVDMSESISDSINSLTETVLLAFLFVMLIVLLFLGRWRATFIIIVTIPVSLVVEFIYLKLTGSTLNIISLSSLSIAIGMVVDDAIVVLENITTHIERGSSPKEAAIYATNEVWLAVIATTLVIVAVFLPMTMLSGMAGIMFRELGMIVTLVTIVSTIAAITLTPMLSSLMLKAEKEHTYKGLGIFFKPIDKALDSLDNAYARFLAWSVKHRTVVLIVAFGIFLSSITLVSAVPSEFFPKSDDSRITATIKLEQGVGTEYTKVVARGIDSIINEKYPEIYILSTSAGVASKNTIFTAMQGTSGTHVINYQMRLHDGSQRDRSIFEIADLFRKDLDGIAEVDDYKVTTGGGGMMGSGSDISVKIFGHDMNAADSVARLMQSKIKGIRGAKDVQLSRDDMRRELRVKFDRTRLGHYGLTTAQASMAVRNRINGLLASQYREDGDEYDIYVRYDEKFRTSVEDIENIIIYTPMGRPLRIADVGVVVEEFAPPTIERENRERVVSINMNLSGAAMSEVVAGINGIMADMTTPDDLFIEIGGNYEDQQESFADIITLMFLITVLVYIVMATQFESFKMPLIILFSLPFAFTGVFLALYITNTPLSVIALIGAIMLVGIVVKNGIVIVDFTNLLCERSESTVQAVINAGKSRLRPVLMTTLTTILGMTPMALGMGEGSEIWQPMGIAVIGGLTFSTILTLVVIPVVYTIFVGNDVKKERKRRLKEGRNRKAKTV